MDLIRNLSSLQQILKGQNPGTRNDRVPNFDTPKWNPGPILPLSWWGCKTWRFRPSRMNSMKLWRFLQPKVGVFRLEKNMGTFGPFFFKHANWRFIVQPQIWIIPYQSCRVSRSHGNLGKGLGPIHTPSPCRGRTWRVLITKTSLQYQFHVRSGNHFRPQVVQGIKGTILVPRCGYYFICHETRIPSLSPSSISLFISTGVWLSLLMLTLILDPQGVGKRWWVFPRNRDPPTFPAHSISFWEDQSWKVSRNPCIVGCCSNMRFVRCYGILNHDLYAIRIPYWHRFELWVNEDNFTILIHSKDAATFTGHLVWWSIPLKRVIFWFWFRNQSLLEIQISWGSKLSSPCGWVLPAQSMHRGCIIFIRCASLHISEQFWTSTWIITYNYHISWRLCIVLLKRACEHKHR